MDDDPGDGPQDGPDQGHSSGRLGEVDDPSDSELLRRWEDEEHVETLHPRRNWTPLLVTALVVIVGALAALVVGSAIPDGDSAEAPADADEERAASVLEEEPPSLDELTSEVTIPPGPESGLSVVDKGVTVVEDRFDPARREGTFAAVIVNPHAGWIAQGVQVSVRLVDAAGATVRTEEAFVEVVLPQQEVAVASLFFDAPTVPVADLGVDLDVARWRETDAIEGGFTTGQVKTEEAEYSGVRTTFELRSSFDDELSDVGVTAVYRNGFGGIIGGADTFVDALEPGVPVPAEIALLANVPIEAVASTELYPSASFGYVPDG
jgi:hypothetical protein